VHTKGKGNVPGVLIVDDDPVVRELFADVLGGDSRLTVAGEASDGRQAVEVAARLQPDAIILDQQMPGMTGVEALPELRRLAPNSVVVVLSGGPAPETERLALEAGADAFFAKGTRMSELIACILKLIGGRRGE
jgi:two-component system, NarL family, response regulator